MNYSKADYPEYDFCQLDDSNALIHKDGMYQDEMKLSGCSINWLPDKFERPYGNYTYKTEREKVPQVMLRALASNEGNNLKNADNTYKTDEQLCNLVNSTKPTKKWLELQNDYINSLTKYEKDIIMYYTFHGNNVINAVLRGNPEKAYDLIDADDEFINEYIPEYYDFDQDVTESKLSVMETLKDVAHELNRVILGAPKLDKNIVTYRGVDNADFLKPGTYKTEGILSSSLWIEVAMIYPTIICDDVYGYLAVIEIPKGTAVLFLGGPEISNFSWEKEILIPHNVDYVVDDTIEEREIVTLKKGDANMFLTYGFCLDSINPKKVITRKVMISKD